MKTIRIGLFGYGVVGSGFDRLVQRLEGAVIKRIAVKHPARHPELAADVLTGDRFALLYDEDIDVIVEAIDDADAAFEILKLALQLGKPVITANKRMVAAHLPEIIRLQRRFHTPVLYEAACCAGIPLVRTLEEYSRPELSYRLRGIINGSTNYILTAMERFRFRFNHALQLAQEAGFAESDASLDVEGKDATHKLSIIIRHLWGTYIAPQQIVHTGIQHILPQDLRMAEHLNSVVRLVAQTLRHEGGVAAFILPRLIPKGDMLYNVLHEYNGIVLEDEQGDDHLLYGKGSGAAPTAHGLWADLQALQRGYRYHYREKNGLQLTHDQEIAVHLSVPEGAKIPEPVSGMLQHYASDSRYAYYVGRIGIGQLAENHWWKQGGISLVDVSDIEAEGPDELREKFESVLALQTDIFQPV